MNKTVFLVVLVLGLVLLAFGAIESDSISSDFSRLFTGEPTDKAVWLLIGGAVATIVGLGGMARGSK
jgi:Protein of unknown function (DUF3185)